VTFSDLWKRSTTGNASDVQYYTLQDQKNELYYHQGKLPKWYYVRFNDIGYLVLSMSISDSNSANWLVKGNIDFLSRPGTESGENIWNGTIFRDSDTATTEGFTAISSLYPTSGTGEVGWDNTMAGGSTAQTFLEATEGTIFKYGNVGIGTTNPTAKLEVNGNLAISGMLKTSNPAFSVNIAGGGNTGPSYNGGAAVVVPYGDVTLNKGNNYSATSYVFTAPIAGIYTFTWGAIGNNGSGVYSYYPYKNGAHLQTIGGKNIQLRIDTTASGSNYGNGEKTIVVSLVENDALGIRFQRSSGSSNDYGHTYTYFQGYLISYT
jgi:hypothetical protein